MNLKTIKIEVFSILLILIISSNITQAQTKVGIRAGVNFSSVLMEDENGDKNPTTSLPGFHVGLTVDIPIVADLYLQPAALYSGKGFKQKDNGFSGNGNDIKVTISYIEVPLNFLYKPKLGTGKLLIGAGPYVGYGTSGEWESKNDVLIGDIMIQNHGEIIFKNDETDGEFGSYNYGKRWDFGANFLVGYEFFEKLSVQLNAQLGIRDLKPEVDGVKRTGTLKNKGYGISVGYKF